MKVRRPTRSSSRGPVPSGVPAVLRRALRGCYVVQRRLGRGSMAAVYLADDLRHGRQVAIKVLHPELADLVGARRFRHEVEHVAAFAHPHIVPLLDSGSVGDTLYYIMPFFPDGSLAERLARGSPLPISEALQLARDVAGALHYAHTHSRPLIHRDIKPQNIMLSGGHALVVDFGIARAVLTASGEHLTPSGSNPGTPLYMSPEQAMGEKDLDPRSDQYSLACVAYEMLAGQPPFAGHYVEMLAYQHRSLEPRPIRSLRADVPPEVAHAIERALAKKPADRFESVAAFAGAMGVESSTVSTPAPPAAVETRGHLPSPTTSFIGRETELWECGLRIDRNRLLTLTGPGGCGKTRLALRLGERRLHDYENGVWFVDLAIVQDSLRVPQAVATALAVREEAGRPVAESLRTHLADRRALLILDNCEHVRDSAASLVQTLLAGSSRLKCLATSREPLHLPAEETYAVPPLGLPAPDRAASADAIAGAESVRLFVERGAAAQPGFELVDRNAEAVAEICAHLDGAPLALELAAARLRMLSVEEIRVRLRDRFRLLTAAAEETPRHRTLEAACQWSYDLLEPGEQRLFRALSVFAGGWTLEAATAVFSDGADEYAVLDGMTRLADKSLLVVERQLETETRYRYLETLRQFALVRLETEAAAGELRERHLDHFLALAERAARELRGSHQARWLLTLDHDHENLLAAMAWSARGSGAEKGLRIASALYPYWNIRGYFEVGRRLFSELLGHPRCAAATPARSEALYATAGLAVFQGDGAAARPLYEESMAIVRRLGDRPGTARVLVGLGTLEANEGHYDRARELHEEALALHREIGASATPGMITALHNLGYIAFCHHDYDAAVRHFAGSIELGRDQGSTAQRAATLASLGAAEIRRGQRDSARRALMEGLRLAHELRAVNYGAVAFEATAELLLAEGRAEDAAAIFAAARRQREIAGFSAGVGVQEGQSNTLEHLRASLGDERLERAWSAGSRWSFDCAVRAALERLDPAGQVRPGGLEE